MSDLEGAAQGALTDLILDNTTSRTLNQETLALLAFWMAKTMLMFQFINREGPTIPPVWFRWLYESREPPPGLRIWIAATDGITGGLYRHHRLKLQGTVTGNKGYGYAATFAVRHLAFQVIGHTYPSGMTFSREQEEVYLAPVWPVEEAQAWPRDATLTFAGWQALANAPIPQAG